MSSRLGTTWWSSQDELGKALTNQAPWANYVSVQEEPQAAGAELDHLMEKGYAFFYETWED
eukprot:14181869-Heterocapsa_arctica.AAC.1